MQFSTAVVMALATAVSATKRAAITADVDVYNFSDCSVDSVDSFELAVGECHTFEQGYGSASYTLNGAEGLPYLLVAFKGENCTGQPTPTGECAVNMDGEAIWSVGLTENPAALN